jgi:hypothetical protein
MANVTRQTFQKGSLHCELLPDGTWAITARAQFTFPDTGENGTVEVVDVLSAAQADPTTGARFGAIVNTAKASLKTKLEGLRGKTNTVTEDPDFPA